MKIVKFVTIVTLLLALGCGQRPQPTVPGAEDDTSPEAVIPFNRAASEEMKAELVGKTIVISPRGVYWKVDKNDLIHELTITQVKAVRGAKDEIEAQATIDMTTPWRPKDDSGFVRGRLKGPVTLTYMFAGQRWTLSGVKATNAFYTVEKK